MGKREGLAIIGMTNLQDGFTVLFPQKIKNKTAAGGS